MLLLVLSAVAVPLRVLRLLLLLLVTIVAPVPIPRRRRLLLPLLLPLPAMASMVLRPPRPMRLLLLLLLQCCQVCYDYRHVPVTIANAIYTFITCCDHLRYNSWHYGAEAIQRLPLRLALSAAISRHVFVSSVLPGSCLHIGHSGLRLSHWSMQRWWYLARALGLEVSDYCLGSAVFNDSYLGTPTGITWLGNQQKNYKVGRCHNRLP